MKMFFVRLHIMVSTALLEIHVLYQVGRVVILPKTHVARYALPKYVDGILKKFILYNIDIGHHCR